MLLLPKPVHDQMVAHCLTGLPDEACGLLGGDPETGEAVTCYPTRNLAGSAKLYTVDPKEHLRADRDAEAVGPLHHRRLPLPYPHRGLSVARPMWSQAPDPSWHYVLVSLRDVQPVVRSYRIDAGTVSEEPVRLQSQ